MPSAQRPDDLRSRLGKAARAGKPDTTVAPDETDDERDQRLAFQRRSERKRQQGINFDVDLLLYARDVVVVMSRKFPQEPGSASLAALIDQSLREKIADWERKFNGGRPFHIG